MNRTPSRFVTAGTALLLILMCSTAWAQSQGATLSGRISGPSGAGISDARISVKSAATGQIVEARSDPAGNYRVPNLAPGEYEILVSADGYVEKTARLTIGTGASQTLDLSLGAALSLGDLGFTPAAIQGNPKEQARLDKRTHILKIHQKLGLITTIPMIATVVSGSFTKQNPSFRDLASGFIKPILTDCNAPAGSVGNLHLSSAHFECRLE